MTTALTCSSVRGSSGGGGFLQGGGEEEFAPLTSSTLKTLDSSEEEEEDEATSALVSPLHDSHLEPLLRIKAAARRRLLAERSFTISSVCRAPHLSSAAPWIAATEANDHNHQAVQYRTRRRRRRAAYLSRLLTSAAVVRSSATIWNLVNSSTSSPAPPPPSSRTNNNFIDDDDSCGSSIVSETTSFRRIQWAHPYDSEQMYRQDARVRDRAYKRDHLGGARAAGLAGGLGLASPLEVQSPNMWQSTTAGGGGGVRQLRPLRRRYPSTVVPPSPQHAQQPNSVQDRQVINIVNACWDLGLPELVGERGSEACALYRRLARALDERAAPSDRLFIDGGRDDDPFCSSSISSSSPLLNRWRWREQREYESRQPVWMRGSVSKLLFGKGTNLFHPRYTTSLADYDPQK